MSKHFKISLLSNEISSLLILLLQRLLMREHLQELHTMTKLEPGGDGVKYCQSVGCSHFYMDGLSKQEKILILGVFCRGCQIRMILRKTLWDTG
jgi:hypothetical protein